MNFSYLYKVCAVTTEAMSTSINSALQRLELDASEISRYQIAIRDAFVHIQCTELKEMFVAKLTTFLDAQFGSQKPIKVTLKILGIFTSNILNLLQDKELPERIKHLVVQKMPESTKILEKMYRRDPRTLLQDMRGENTFGRYQEACQVLKQRLIKDKDPAGVTFSGRDIKLFAWCREELEATANPLIGVLFEDPKVAEGKGEIALQFSALFDTLNRLIFQIGASDDIADNIQDEFLTKIFTDIPFSDSAKLEKYKVDVATYCGGIFSEYFDATVTIWQDATQQLERLFGGYYFQEKIKDRFLEIFQTIAGSLTYSQYMNANPHDKGITQETIAHNLAPNIMVQCFRYLELELTEKIAAEYGVVLPDQSDFVRLDRIILASQENAASSNAAATASRELRENDLSSQFPFAINEKYKGTLKEQESTFVAEFEEFLRTEGYINHFFETYSEPGENFDYLDLLLIRRDALTQVVERLDRIIKRGRFVVPDSDYSINSLATKGIEFAETYSNETLNKEAAMLTKLKSHIELIDKFSEKLMLETGVQEEFFDGWLREIENMKQDALQIKDPSLCRHTLTYVESWETFLTMYLIFKRSFDGTI